MRVMGNIVRRNMSRRESVDQQVQKFDRARRTHGDFPDHNRRCLRQVWHRDRQYYCRAWWLWQPGRWPRLAGLVLNVASGLMLMTLRPFTVGDIIEVGEGQVYVIDDIGLLVTMAHRLDGPNIMIPNNTLWSASVTNFNRTTDGFRRVDLVFGISYNDDIDKAQAGIGETLDADDRCRDEPGDQIVVQSLGDSSVNILMRVWVDWPVVRMSTSTSPRTSSKPSIRMVSLSIPAARWPPVQDVQLARKALLASRACTGSQPPRHGQPAGLAVFYLFVNYRVCQSSIAG